MAPAEIVTELLAPHGSNAHYHLLGIWVLNDKTAPAMFLDNIIVPLLSGFPHSITIKEVHASRYAMCPPASKGGYIKQTAYLDPKIKVLKLFNTYFLEEFLTSDVLVGSILETFVCISAFTDYWRNKNVYINAQIVYSSLANRCHELAHMCFHTQADSIDTSIAAALSPQDNSRALSRMERKAARQSNKYHFSCLEGGLKSLRTVSVRTGHLSEISDQELLQLRTLHPNLNALGIPCPVITEAVEDGRLSDDTRDDIREQAEIVSHFLGLETIHLLCAEPCEELYGLFEDVGVSRPGLFEEAGEKACSMDPSSSSIGAKDIYSSVLITELI